MSIKEVLTQITNELLEEEEKNEKDEIRLQPDDCIKELIDDIRDCVESP